MVNHGLNAIWDVQQKTPTSTVRPSGRGYDRRMDAVQHFVANAIPLISSADSYIQLIGRTVRLNWTDVIVPIVDFATSSIQRFHTNHDSQQLDSYRALYNAAASLQDKAGREWSGTVTGAVGALQPDDGKNKAAIPALNSFDRLLNDPENHFQIERRRELWFQARQEIDEAQTNATHPSEVVGYLADNTNWQHGVASDDRELDFDQMLARGSDAAQLQWPPEQQLGVMQQSSFGILSPPTIWNAIQGMVTKWQQTSFLHQAWVLCVVALLLPSLLLLAAIALPTIAMATVASILVCYCFSIQHPTVPSVPTPRISLSAVCSPAGKGFDRWSSHLLSPKLSKLLWEPFAPLPAIPSFRILSHAQLSPTHFSTSDASEVQDLLSQPSENADSQDEGMFSPICNERRMSSAVRFLHFSEFSPDISPVKPRVLNWQDQQQIADVSGGNGAPCSIGQLTGGDSSLPAIHELCCDMELVSGVGASLSVSSQGTEVQDGELTQGEGGSEHELQNADGDAAVGKAAFDTVLASGTSSADGSAHDVGLDSSSSAGSHAGAYDLGFALDSCCENVVGFSVACCHLPAAHARDVSIPECGGSADGVVQVEEPIVPHNACATEDVVSHPCSANSRSVLTVVELAFEDENESATVRGQTKVRSANGYHQRRDEFDADEDDWDSDSMAVDELPDWMRDLMNTSEEPVPEPTRVQSTGDHCGDCDEFDEDDWNSGSMAVDELPDWMKDLMKVEQTEAGSEQTHNSADSSAALGVTKPDADNGVLCVNVHATAMSWCWDASSADKRADSTDKRADSADKRADAAAKRAESALQREVASAYDELELWHMDVRDLLLEREKMLGQIRRLQEENERETFFYAKVMHELNEETERHEEIMSAYRTKVASLVGRVLYKQRRVATSLEQPAAQYAPDCLPNVSSPKAMVDESDMLSQSLEQGRAGTAEPGLKVGMCCKEAAMLINSSMDGQDGAAASREGLMTSGALSGQAEGRQTAARIAVSSFDAGSSQEQSNSAQGVHDPIAVHDSVSSNIHSSYAAAMSAYSFLHEQLDETEQCLSSMPPSEALVEEIQAAISSAQQYVTRLRSANCPLSAERDMLEGKIRRLQGEGYPSERLYHRLSDLMWLHSAMESAARRELQRLELASSVFVRQKKKLAAFRGCGRGRGPAVDVRRRERCGGGGNDPWPLPRYPKVRPDGGAGNGAKTAGKLLGRRSAAATHGLCVECVMLHVTVSWLW